VAGALTDGVPTGFALSNRNLPTLIQFWPARAGIGYWPPDGEPAEASAISDIGSFDPLVAERRL